MKRQIRNSATGLVYQLLLIIYSFIMPRLYIVYYGSEMNGLISSISQFLGVISLMDMGVGAIVQFNFYKPLADHDNDQISRVYVSASKYFKKIVMVYFMYLIVFTIIYPCAMNKFNLFTIILILILAINLVADYLFGIVNQYLLIADQKNYITHIVSSVLLIINCLIGIMLITHSVSILVVKFIYAVVLLIKPLVYVLYVKKNYKINKKIVYDKEPLKQKWNGIIQHLTFFVTTSTDTIILTFFSTLENISVYCVYNLVVNGIKQIVTSLMSGVDAMFGNLIANNQKEKLLDIFSRFEWIFHNIIVFLYGCTMMLITSFVLLYTKNVNDANYNHPLFGIIMSLAVAFWCLRTVYYTLVKAAGHYKQTQTSAVVEMLLNITISIIGVKCFGLVGVAFGTLVAMCYRTIYLAYYIRNILDYSLIEFWKHIFVDFVHICIVAFCYILHFQCADNFFEWLLSALYIVVISVISLLVLNLLFYKEYIVEYCNKLIYKQ